MNMILGLLAGVGGALVLSVFYIAVAGRWPESYTSAENAILRLARASTLRYAAFRVVPVYTVGVFVAVTASRLAISSRAAVLTCIILHISMTNGRALAALGSRSASRRMALLIYYTFTVGGLALTCIAVLLSYHWWTSLTPSPADIVVGLWIGVVSAVLGALIQRVSAEGVQPEGILARAKQDLGPDLCSRIQSSADAQSCDGDLLMAIVAAEVTQRPRWFRRLERIKGAVQPSGSYGVAQMNSSKPITDGTSIELLAAAFAGFYPTRTSSGSVREGPLGAALDRHNTSAEFQRLVMDLYSELEPDARWQSSELAFDGRPVVRCTDLRRRGDQWVISGDAWIPRGHLTLKVEVEDANVETLQIADLSNDRRTTWEAEISIESDLVWINSASADDPAGITIDLSYE